MASSIQLKASPWAVIGTSRAAPAVSERVASTVRSRTGQVPRAASRAGSAVPSSTSRPRRRRGPVRGRRGRGRRTGRRPPDHPSVAHSPVGRRQRGAPAPTAQPRLHGAVLGRATASDSPRAPRSPLGVRTKPLGAHDRTVQVTPPQLERHPVDGETAGSHCSCHGGTAQPGPPKDRALSRWCACGAFERYVRDELDGRGVETALVRYRVAGWNGEAADAYQDVQWSIEQLRAELGKDVPVVLVGHSMGGRAALKAGGDPQVTASARWRVDPPGRAGHAAARPDRGDPARLGRPLGACEALGRLRGARAARRCAGGPLHAARWPLHAAGVAQVARLRPRRRARRHRTRNDAGRRGERPPAAEPEGLAVPL